MKSIERSVVFHELICRKVFFMGGAWGEFFRKNIILDEKEVEVHTAFVTVEAIQTGP